MIFFYLALLCVSLITAVWSQPPLCTNLSIVTNSLEPTNHSISLNGSSFNLTLTSPLPPVSQPLVINLQLANSTNQMIGTNLILDPGNPTKVKCTTFMGSEDFSVPYGTHVNLVLNVSCDSIFKVQTYPSLLTVAEPSLDTFAPLKLIKGHSNDLRFYFIHWRPSNGRFLTFTLGESGTFCNVTSSGPDTSVTCNVAETKSNSTTGHVSLGPPVSHSIHLDYALVRRPEIASISGKFFHNSGVPLMLNLTSEDLQNLYNPRLVMNDSVTPDLCNMSSLLECPVRTKTPVVTPTNLTVGFETHGHPVQGIQLQILQLPNPRLVTVNYTYETRSVTLKVAHFDPYYLRLTTIHMKPIFNLSTIPCTDINLVQPDYLICTLPLNFDPKTGTIYHLYVFINVFPLTIDLRIPPYTNIPLVLLLSLFLLLVVVIVFVTYENLKPPAEALAPIEILAPIQELTEAQFSAQNETTSKPVIPKSRESLLQSATVQVKGKEKPKPPHKSPSVIDLKARNVQPQRIPSVKYTPNYLQKENVKSNSSRSEIPPNPGPKNR